MDPRVSEEDVEAIADAALGLTHDSPDPALRLELSARERRRRLTRVGAKLTARQCLSDRRKRKFLAELSGRGNIGLAAAAAGWARSTAYAMREADPEFKAAWDHAIEFSTDLLEEAARSRGVDGVLEPIYQQKELVGYKRVYSDKLLSDLLRAKRPEQFRDNVKVDADVKGGVLVIPRSESDADWERRAFEQQAKYRANQGDDDGLD